MEIVTDITRTTLEEIEKLITTRTVVGDPMTIEGVTIIPLISVGFGFGAGGGSGKGESKQKAEGAAGGTGGGAWVRPVSVIIIDKDGVRVEPVKRGLSSMMEKVTDTVPKVVEKIVDRNKKEEKSTPGEE
jgi:sporulation protein YtfJ